MQLTRNFTDDEFKCSCCHKEKMDRNFVARLQTAREIAGAPFHINSGWRCQEHNDEVGGAKGSSHLTGHAADIRAATSQKRFVIVNALREAGFERIGIAKTFVHVDDDAAKSQRVMWLY